MVRGHVGERDLRRRKHGRSDCGHYEDGCHSAYPDIIAMAASGKILMIETKDDHLYNDESKAKAKTGHQWANLAGAQ